MNFFDLVLGLSAGLVLDTVSELLGCDVVWKQKGY